MPPSRLLLPAALALAAALSPAQGNPAQDNPSQGNGSPSPAPRPEPLPPLFLAAAPEATVVVTRHPTGADLVEVTVVRADYPPDALRRACERVGELTGVPVRGLTVGNTNPLSGKGFPKATFATNGLVADAPPRFRLEPVLRAFGFSASPLKALAIIYNGERADASVLRTFATPAAHGRPAGALRVAAQRLPPGPGSPAGGVEYRTLLTDARESDVVLPGPRAAGARPAPSAPPAAPDNTLPIVGAVGALAAGGLVYALVARPRPDPRAKPATRPGKNAGR